MGKGKTTTDSKSAYTDITNKCIDNTIFTSDRVCNYEEQKKKHTRKFLTRNFINSNNVLTVTRNPLTMDASKARLSFTKITSEFEKSSNLKLSDISKTELLYHFLNFSETTNSIIHLKDDARQFLVYKFLYPDIMKLYLYKIFYPRIFDFDIEESGNIKFRSSYIEENFVQIFQDIEFMCMTMVYDAMIMAIENCFNRHIRAMKNYQAHIDPYSDVPSIMAGLDKEFSLKKEIRKDIIEKYKYSIAFLLKHFSYVYKNRSNECKLITSILKYDTFFSGKRSDDSRNALISAYRDCSKILYEDVPPFTMLLNLYYINKRSHLYDLHIMKSNIEFMPYTLDGIITKHHINNMITKNNDAIKNPSSPSLKLTSLYNNPNCIISNISLKDYEMLNYIITSTAKSLEQYYLIHDNRDIKTSEMCNIINWLDTNKSTSIIAKTICPFENFDTNSVDYTRVLEWKNPFLPGDELQG